MDQLPDTVPPPRPIRPPMPSLGPPRPTTHAGAVTVALSAAYAGMEIENPLWRFGALLATSVLLYVMGLFQLWPPRRR